MQPYKEIQAKEIAAKAMQYAIASDEDTGGDVTLVVIPQAAQKGVWSLKLVGTDISCTLIGLTELTMETLIQLMTPMVTLIQATTQYGVSCVFKEVQAKTRVAQGGVLLAADTMKTTTTTIKNKKTRIYVRSGFKTPKVAHKV